MGRKREGREGWKKRDRERERGCRKEEIDSGKEGEGKGRDHRKKERGSGKEGRKKAERKRE